MALSTDSTLGDILDDENGKAILEKHMPGVSSDPRIAMARGMTLKALMPLSQGMLNEEKLKAINDDLSKI